MFSVLPDWDALQQGTRPHTRVKRRRPSVYVTDGPFGKVRAGVVWGIDGAEVTIRLHLEAHRVGTRVVDGGLWTGAAALTVGAPVCCVVEGAGADDYVVTAVHPGSWSPGATVKSEGADVAAGVFNQAIVPAALGGAPDYYDESW